MYLCICLFNNKVVEGSGSEGASKYMGEGVTYRVFLGILIAFLHMCVSADMVHWQPLTCLLMPVTT